MFNRPYLKEMAKARIKAVWGVAVLVALVGMLLTGSRVLQNPYNRIALNYRNSGSVQEFLREWLPYEEGSQDDFYDREDGNRDNDLNDEDLDDFFGQGFGAELPDAWDFRSGENWRIEWGFLCLLLGAAVLAAVSLYSIFVGNVVGTGMRGWFLRYSRGENASFGELFASFRIYMPVVAANFLRGLYTFLWSLLLFIPGIVKSYAYSMTDYIIYENPNLSANQAITLSRELTRGAKWDLFVLDLSFIGWNLLSGLTFGLLGVLYVNPYYSTAHALVYDSLKMTAIQSGRLTWADFGQVAPVYTQPMMGGENS